MSHEHRHTPNDYNRAFVLGVVLNTLYVIFEAGLGALAGSLALIADAGHNMIDVTSLLLAWGAAVWASKAATAKRTYGYRKLTIMASLASALMLLFAVGGIAWEAVNRIVDPQPVAGKSVIIVAGIGVVINGATALLFASGRKHDLNIRGAFLHMAADAGVSLGVVISGIVILMTGWLLIDPIISLCIAVVILAATWKLLQESLNLAIDSVPQHIDIGEVETFLNEQNDVVRIHDLHVWPLSTTAVALSVHLIMRKPPESNNFLSEIQCELHERFGIEHSTIQIERAEGDACILERKIC